MINASIIFVIIVYSYTRIIVDFQIQMFRKHEGKQILQLKNANGSINLIKSKFLGKGGFARCYQMIQEQTDNKYAVKVVRKSQLTEPKLKQALKSQITIHKQMHHDHIVKFFDWFQDKDNFFLLLEVCEDKTLNQLIRNRKYISELEVRYYIKQLIQALIYLQSNKIIHRDIKLCNLFIDKSQLKLGDFGLATKLTNHRQRKYTHCGTINYIAPQILASQKLGHSYEVDIWSLGVVTYTLLFGKYPFESQYQKNIQKKIVNCVYDFPKRPFVSEEAKKFISKIFELDPCKRPTPQELLIDQFITKSQIPKSLPSQALKNPLDNDFIRKYEQKECKQHQKDNALKDITQNIYKNSSEQQQIKQAQQQIDWITAFKQYQKVGFGYLTTQNFMVVRFHDKVSVVAHPQLQKIQVFNQYFQFLTIFQFQNQYPTHFKLFFSIATQMIQHSNPHNQKENQATNNLLNKKAKIPKNIYRFSQGHVIQFSEFQQQFVQNNQVFIKIQANKATFCKQGQQKVVLQVESKTQKLTVKQKIARLMQKSPFRSQLKEDKQNIRQFNY